MVQRKIGENGRLTIPKELLEKYNIEKDDLLEIFDNDGHIGIKKYFPEFVCTITGKITSEGIKIGNAFISHEGLELIKKKLQEENL